MKVLWVRPCDLLQFRITSKIMNQFDACKDFLDGGSQHDAIPRPPRDNVTQKDEDNLHWTFSDYSSRCQYTDRIKCGRTTNFTFKYVNKEEGIKMSPPGIKSLTDIPS
jgi:hypothetical protein